MKTQADKLGYAYNGYRPVQHVAVSLEGAPTGALSASEMAAAYDPDEQDVGRVMHHHNITTRTAALEWMMLNAITELNGQSRNPKIVCNGDNRWHYAQGVGLDDLKWKNRKVYRQQPDDHQRFDAPFDEKKANVIEARWVEHQGKKTPAADRLTDTNIRSIERSDYGELEESLREFGWLPQFPALVDEFGAVLAGHRRIAVANKLGIPVHKEVVACGRGDEADAERLKLALVSNIGFKPMTPTDRQRFAVYLYGEREWSQQRIAEALRVAVNTISLDLMDAEKSGEFPTVGNSKPKRGRPRKQPAPQAHPPLTEAEEAEFFRLTEQEGMSRTAAEKQVRGWDKERRSPTTSVMQMIGRRHATGSQPEPAPPDPLPVEAEPTAQHVHDWMRVCRTCGVADPL